MRRLWCVHDIAVGCDVAVEELRRTVESRCRRSGPFLEPPALIELRALVGRRLWPVRRARTDQPKMIEIGTAERRHEEVVSENELARNVPHRKLAALVVTHTQTTRAGERC